MWKANVHRGLTEKWAKDVGFSNADAKEIADANDKVDFDLIGFRALLETEPITSFFIENADKLSWHYNMSSERETDSRLQIFKQQSRRAQGHATGSGGWPKSRINALIEFGRGLHALQDYYAHMNWDPSDKYYIGGYHMAFVCHQGKGYIKANVFDDMSYDLAWEYVLIGRLNPKTAWGPNGPYLVMEFIPDQEKWVFVATSGGERIRKTEEATKAAMRAFKEVLDGNASSMGMLTFEHYLDKNASFSISLY